MVIRRLLQIDCRGSGGGRPETGEVNVLNFNCGDQLLNSLNMLEPWTCTFSPGGFYAGEGLHLQRDPEAIEIRRGSSHWRMRILGIDEDTRRRRQQGQGRGGL